MAGNAFIPPAAPRVCPHCGASLPDDLPPTTGETPHCPHCQKPLPSPGEWGPRATKLFGLGLCASGAALIYWFDYEPWCKIEEGVPEVSMSLKGAAFGPFLLGVGLAFFLPNRPAPGEKEPLSLRLFRGVLLVLMLAGFVGGVVIYFWLRSYARDHGYEV